MKKITYLLILSALFTANQLLAQENSISENGNVGIGTTTPSARLQVAGSARFDSTVVANDSVSMTRNVAIGGDLKVGGNVYFPNIPTLNGIHDETILFTNGDGAVVKFAAAKLREHMYAGLCDLAGGVNDSPTWANGPNKIFVECPSVFVGIGTNNPTRNLDVVGNTKVSGHLWSHGSLSIGSDFNPFSKFSIVNTNATAVIQGKAVGNTKPYQRLMFFEYDNPDTKILEVINTATGRTPFSLKADGAMDIDNGVANILHLGTNGMFSISNGVQKTFVVEASGLTRARKIKVDADVWADYVFEDNYVLMPLSEVENFLKEHKHLPSIPSEQVMKEEGIDVAEMNVKMMEKIEELTLYLIQQNKELEKLKAELEILKQQKP